MMMKKRRGSNGNEVPKRKEWHIVSWSQEEDDILREQIRTHGTENWGIIASKFHDKTARQCRRRWFTYLNSVFKKGGWSPEEDMLLCEAQKIFGNRWTEIAKVVSGRTDNAVKNRFATLRRRRAKHEALAKENNFSSYINLNNKRVLFTTGGDHDGGVVPKKTRICITENRGCDECNVTVLAQNSSSQLHSDGSENNEIQGMFLEKDDPKALALIQRAQLLSSLAIKVNSENAWMALEDFLKESDLVAFGDPETDFQLDKLKEMMRDLRSGWREPDLHELSPESSEYSTGSTLLSNVQTGNEFQSILDQGTEYVLTCGNIGDNHEAVFEYSDPVFGSPVHVTPLFTSLAAAIPSPKFSESEKHFLMKTLGMESTTSGSAIGASQPPPCKRSLMHCL